MFDVFAWKNSVADLRKRLSVIGQEVDGLRAQQTALACLPLPFDDFVAWMVGKIDMLADTWPESVSGFFLQQGQRPFFEVRSPDYGTTDQFMDTYGPKEGTAGRLFEYSGRGGSIGNNALFWCFRDQFKKGLEAALRESLSEKWPKKVGLPRAQRIKKLQEFDAAIEKLEAERAEILSGLKSVAEAA